MKLIIILLVTLPLTPHAFANREEEVLANIKKLASNLKRELKKGLKKSPTDAVNVCHIKAVEIQQQVSNSKMQIGRVSLKNRNPNNYPKDWMLKHIKAFHNKDIKKKYLVVPLKNGKQGLLKPIVTMPLCLKCHGTNIEPTLQKEITRLYPQDKAVGYSSGQIRGFFWAEY